MIATDVGNCRGLLYGEGDDFGEGGILTHIMNIEEISHAILELANNSERRTRMGENGYRRLMHKYKISDMKKTYDEIYTGFEDGLFVSSGKELPHASDRIRQELPQETDGIREEPPREADGIREEPPREPEESLEDWADIGDEPFDGWADIEEDSLEDWADIEEDSFDGWADIEKTDDKES